MKLSENTVKLLKNFASINQSIFIRAGNLLSTQSIAGDMLAEANVEDEFPIEFCLYDLPEFLNTLKLFSSPLLDFREADSGYMYICEEDNFEFKVRYTFAKKEKIVYPVRRALIGDINISFELENTVLESIIKASNVMQLPFMMIRPNENADMITIEVADIKDTSSNKFSIGIDATAPKDKDYSIIFRMESLKMLPGDYNVGIEGNRAAAFESDMVDYYVGLDVNSTF